jgi:hypothetical protein
MKILIISAEVWRHDTNGGNVLSNIFNNVDADFAQVYCNPGSPSNNLCKKYFQITDSMVIKNVLKKSKVGREINYENFPSDAEKKAVTVKGDNSFYKFFKRFNFQSFYLIKELIWALANWKNKDLDTFINEFEPDIVFAPCYGSLAMLSLTRHVAKTTRSPIISYISDDHYTLRQFSLSPIFWLNRFLLRKAITKTFPYYTLVYTMTDEQLTEYSSALNCNMKILRKAASITEFNPTKQDSSPIKLIYAGGIYAGRSETLQEISLALKNINKQGTKIILNIFTGTDLTPNEMNVLNDKSNSFVHGLVTPEELKIQYDNSHVALHVESFDLKYRLLTRLSFSTKIVDCLSSGCAVMAICWDEHSGYKYLENEDAAICVSSIADIPHVLEDITSKPELISLYRDKALKTCYKNHVQEHITTMLRNDFEAVYEESKFESSTNKRG